MNRPDESSYRPDCLQALPLLEGETANAVPPDKGCYTGHSAAVIP
jgi:hypothetical protein